MGEGDTYYDYQVGLKLSDNFQLSYYDGADVA